MTYHPHFDLYCRRHGVRIGGCRCPDETKVRQTTACPGDRCARAWTMRHPRGTKMLYHPVRGDMRAEAVRVRSDAWVLGSGDVVVKVTGHVGGVCIDHLQDWPESDDDDVKEEA